MTFPAARPTTYKGIRMRSRLEARVAAVIDEDWDCEWWYEPNAFADESGQYLPDFLVRFPGNPIAYYFEVKPTVEAAEAVIPRMEIIWSSDPDATLGIIVPNADAAGELVGRFLAFGRDRVWYELPSDGPSRVVK